jgi:UMP-CMP kinase
VSEKFKYTHLSAGDLLREERQRPGSEFGELIERYIREGAIVPVHITVNLLKRAMDGVSASNPDVAQKFLIDGYPRNADNLAGWMELLPESLVHVSACLFFDCPEEVMEQRLLSRGQTSGRSDDNIESIRKRFKTYVNDTVPVIEQFRDRGLLHTVRADQSVDDVWSQVQTIFARL